MNPLSDRSIVVNTPQRKTQSADHILRQNFGRRQLSILEGEFTSDLAAVQAARALDCAVGKVFLGAGTALLPA